MGRSLLIICAGLVMAFGFTIINVSGQKESMAASNVNTYYKAKASNMALTGIQFAIHKYSESEDKDGFSGFVKEYNNAQLTLSLQKTQPQVIKITSAASFNGIEETVIAFFEIAVDSPIPKFKGALTIANGDFTFSSVSNDLLINGNDNSGTCQDNAAGLTVPEQEDKERVKDNIISNQAELKGDPPVDVDSNNDFSKVSNLINELAKKDDVTHLHGMYIANSMDFGTATDPGVFFIDNYVNIIGNNVEGYGILVIRNNARLNIEGSLGVTANSFNFHGLVIFENAFAFNITANSSTISGSVIIGQTDNYNGDINIDFTANDLTFQYDCDAQKYAEKAVEGMVSGSTVFNPMSIYE